MNISQDYLSRSQDIIGERTADEKKYDDEVIKGLQKWRNIKKAIKNANKKYPQEALMFDENNIGNIAAHYDYLMKHEQIMRNIERKIN